MYEKHAVKKNQNQRSINLLDRVFILACLVDDLANAVVRIIHAMHAVHSVVRRRRRSTRRRSSMVIGRSGRRRGHVCVAFDVLAGGVASVAGIVGVAIGAARGVVLGFGAFVREGARVARRREGIPFAGGVVVVA